MMLTARFGKKIMSNALIVVYFYLINFAGYIGTKSKKAEGC